MATENSAQARWIVRRKIPPPDRANFAHTPHIAIAPGAVNVKWPGKHIGYLLKKPETALNRSKNREPAALAFLGRLKSCYFMLFNIPAFRRRGHSAAFHYRRFLQAGR